MILDLTGQRFEEIYKDMMYIPSYGQYLQTASISMHFKLCVLVEIPIS